MFFYGFSSATDPCRQSKYMPIFYDVKSGIFIVSFWGENRAFADPLPTHWSPNENPLQQYGCFRGEFIVSFTGIKKKVKQGGSKSNKQTIEEPLFFGFREVPNARMHKRQNRRKIILLARGCRKYGKFLLPLPSQRFRGRKKTQ